MRGTEDTSGRGPFQYLSQTHQRCVISLQPVIAHGLEKLFVTMQRSTNLGETQQNERPQQAALYKRHHTKHKSRVCEASSATASSDSFV